MRSDRPQSAPLGLKIAAACGLLFLHLPILLIFVYAFTSEEKSYQWPPPGFTTGWFAVTWNRPDVWRALSLSVQVATISTLIALVLGTLCAAAVSRTKFFGRETISLLVILPIALPGIITGIALRSAFALAEIPFSFWTIVLGHATFCVVVVYNNAVARFRRTSGSLIEASYDLGADGFQTFRYCVLPNIATALLAGGMLAFALSFDPSAPAARHQRGGHGRGAGDAAAHPCRLLSHPRWRPGRRVGQIRENFHGHPDADRREIRKGH